MSLEDETQQLVRKLALEIRKPIIIDGDAITSILKYLPYALIKEREAPDIIMGSGNRIHLIS